MISTAPQSAGRSPMVAHAVVLGVVAVAELLALTLPGTWGALGLTGVVSTLGGVALAGLFLLGAPWSILVGTDPGGGQSVAGTVAQLFAAALLNLAVHWIIALAWRRHRGDRSLSY